MNEKVYCDCSKCLNRKHKEIIAGTLIQWEQKIIVCENSKDISIYHVSSDTIRRTCANYKPKENQYEGRSLDQRKTYESI